MTNTIGTVEALHSLKPKAEWILHGDVLTWIDAVQSEPTQAEIDAEVTRLQAVYDSQAYARNRKAEYDQLNQYEMQFDDKVNSTTTWVDKINEIKGRHPK
jgi:hypothetical protein